MAISDTNWILGIGIMVLLALFLTFLTFKDTETFFIFLTIFSGFVVWAGLVELWVLVINLVVLTLIIINKTFRKGVI